MNKITVTGLKKVFGSEAVLDGISLSVRAGEVMALLGNSGAGKSTLLRCLNLLEVPDAGQIQVNDLTFDFSKKAKPAYKDLLSLRKQVGMVFQQYHLWAHRTILENLMEAPTKVLHRSPSAVLEKAEYLLNEMGILPQKTYYPAQLSGGQQQRAAIARALMMEPDIMLFDEPTSSLDPQKTASVINLIKNLADKGMTIIIATHVMKVARELAHQTLFLYEGKIIEQGNTQKLFSCPQTEKFQSFIGQTA